MDLTSQIVEKARSNCIKIPLDKKGFNYPLKGLKRRLLESKISIDCYNDVSKIFFLPQGDLFEASSLEFDIDFSPRNGIFRIWGSKIKFSDLVYFNEVIVIGQTHVGSSIDENCPNNNEQKVFDNVADLIYKFHNDKIIKTEEIYNLTKSGIRKNAIDYFKEKYRDYLNMEEALK